MIHHVFAIFPFTTKPGWLAIEFQRKAWYKLEWTLHRNQLDRHIAKSCFSVSSVKTFVQWKSSSADFQSHSVTFSQSAKLADQLERRQEFLAFNGVTAKRLVQLVLGLHDKNFVAYFSLFFSFCKHISSYGSSGATPRFFQMRLVLGSSTM